MRDRRGPTLSVVIPVFEGGDLLDAALASVLGQRYRHLDVVVIDDGSTDGSGDVARRWAERDDRVQVMRQDNAGQSAARNAGVDLARGEYLTFVDADDLVTHDGIDVAMRGLERSGSDVAVMPYQRLEGDRMAPPAAWIRALHARPALGVTLAQRPDVLVHAIACAKIFRRDFWDASGLGFPPGVIYEDQILTAHAYRDARGIDITAETAYSWRRQESSTSQGQVTVANVTARMDAAEESLRLLEPVPEAREERVMQLLLHNVPNSALKLERADDPYLAVLVERVPRIVATVPEARRRREVPAEQRVLHALLANGDHEPIWAFVRAEGLQSQLHPAGQEPDGWTLHLPGWGSDPVPPSAYALTARQLAMRSTVSAVRRTDDGLEVDVRAWFPHVDLGSLDPVLSARVLTGRGTAPGEVSPRDDEAIFRSRAGTVRRYALSGWKVRVPAPRGVRSVELLLDLRAGAFEGVRSHRVNLPLP